MLSMKFFSFQCDDWNDSGMVCEIQRGGGGGKTNIWIMMYERKIQE